MKRTILILLSLCVSTLTVVGQDGYLASIPVKAGHHLSAQYPDADVLDWVQLSPSCIKAIFIDDPKSRLESEAFYSIQGEWLESHLALQPGETPESILTTIRSIYPDYASITTKLVQSPAKIRRYEVTVRQSQTSYAVISVYPNGQVASDMATR